MVVRLEGRLQLSFAVRLDKHNKHGRQHDECYQKYCKSKMQNYAVDSCCSEKLTNATSSEELILS